MFIGVEFVEGRFLRFPSGLLGLGWRCGLWSCRRVKALFNKSSPPSPTLLKTMSIREKDFFGPVNFSGVIWPRCLFISPVVSRCEEPVHFAVLKAFPDEVPLVSAKRDDWTWATVRARRRKGLGHRTKLKPFLVYLAPRREQLTNVMRLLLVDYVFRRIFFHLLEASVHPTMLNDCFRKKLLFGSFLKILSARL